MTAPEPGHEPASDDVYLTDVNEQTLTQLLAVATRDAAADEVTPPLNSDGAWSPARAQWFLDYHRSRREGLTGPAAEATWAVWLSGAVVGSVRLKRTDEPGQGEAGIWLARDARRRGIAPAAMEVLLQTAQTHGIRSMTASTTVDNRPAIALLEHLQFELRPVENGRDVNAVRTLSPAPAPNATQREPE